MRLGVLDIGSNTGHLLVVDAHGGAAPLPAYSYKEPLRLAEHLDESGAVTQRGIAALTDFTAERRVVAEDKGCEDMLAFATSAVRDARQLRRRARPRARAHRLSIGVLSGEDEARLTFLAVRRWFGWSAGRLAVFDIGGGSLEIAGGADEAPDVAWSVPLGAARLAREHFARGTPDEETVRRLRKQIRAEIARDAGRLLRAGPPDLAAATSKTFRSLGRICGAAPVGRRPARARVRCRSTPWSSGSRSSSRCRRPSWPTCPGVSPSRTHQIVPGALVAEAVHGHLRPDASSQICPWALREGVILERLDQLTALDPR